MFTHKGEYESSCTCTHAPVANSAKEMLEHELLHPELEEGKPNEDGGTITGEETVALSEDKAVVESGKHQQEILEITAGLRQFALDHQQQASQSMPALVFVSVLVWVQILQFVATLHSRTCPCSHCRSATSKPHTRTLSRS